jgi:hypothetical protein
MDGMPRPDANHARLHRLVGAWTGEEKMNPSPWGPGGTALGRYHCRVDVDGFFVLQDYVQEKDGNPTYRGHGIFGWDAERKTFIWYWVDSMGSVPAAPSRGQWNGDSLIFEHEPMGDRRGRYTFEFSGETLLIFRIENSQDGGKSWQTFMEGKYRKI